MLYCKLIFSGELETQISVLKGKNEALTAENLSLDLDLRQAEQRLRKTTSNASLATASERVSTLSESLLERENNLYIFPWIFFFR